MPTLEFDGRQLAEPEDFYQQLTAQVSSAYPFGHNLDALWDWLMGELPLPLCFRFHHLDRHSLRAITPIIELLREAEQATQGQVRVQL